MTNLRNDVLQALQDGKNLDNILNKIANTQEELLKTYSNPVFSNEDKNKLLKQYNELEELGKSITKYQTLKENDYLADAEQEKREIFDKLLNGFITQPKYVWHSEQNTKTCPQCKSLNKSVYYIPGDIPQRPHPNCRCTIKTVEEKPIKTPQNNTVPKPESSQQKAQNETKHPGWIMPCNGPIVGTYGEKRSTHIHNGIDIAVPIGTPVKAIADGTVYYAGANDPDGYGRYVIITHNMNGAIITSEYGHLTSWQVKAGQKVKQGEVIATSGNTGYSHGPHLHLTIRKGRYKGIDVNPQKYIKY